MKRSQLNRIIADAAGFADKMNFKLPPFAFWTPDEWKDKGCEYNEIRDNMLGWDVTDFGSGCFEKTGLIMFTLRNGNMNDPRYIKPYAEKLLIIDEEQVTPFHFHWSKMEDIINRGGGNLMVQVCNSIENGGFADTLVDISTDGRCCSVEAGAVLTITPGESITIPSGQYHKFWGEKGSGRVLLGEVSKVNNDIADNRFYESIGRFPKIEEDAAPQYLLCNEYP